LPKLGRPKDFVPVVAREKGKQVNK